MPEFGVEFSVYENGRKAPEWTIDSDLGGQQSLADFLNFTKQTLIVVADEVLAEEQAQGFDKTPVIVVDGRPGKNVFDVNPLGSIEFVSRANMSDILLATYEAILDKSPIKSGGYKSANLVTYNGTQIASDLPQLTAWLNQNQNFQNKDKIRFVNAEPYARKLERHGVTSDSARAARVLKSKQDRKLAGKSVNVLAPNGVYYLTYRAIRNKYKRNSNIAFEFIPGEQLGVTGGIGADGTRKRTNFVAKRGKPGRTYLYPSILITVAEDGILDVE